MPTTRPRPELDHAARAAREAAQEATMHEARRFLREHANHLARLAAARRASKPIALRQRDSAAVVLLAPLVGMLPV
jgi:hypothetical protein